jgi:hypothetical protein
VLLAKLMRDQIASLKRANAVASERRQRKKKRVQRSGALAKGDREDLVN